MLTFIEGLDTWRAFLIVLDQLLVAFIVYRVFKLLKRTRALQLIAGVVLIILLDLISRSLKLTTLSWLITNISTYLVIGLIILLQPELRRLISEIGRTGIFQWFNPPPEVPVDAILIAVKNMAAQKVGSILVILRGIRPAAIIEQGVPLDAALSTELIETIFFRGSPLHDGALIIEGQKLLAASCYLPLSTSHTLRKTYGARHRAAMGITEETDALAIVTSEESGKVSLLANGEMITPRSSELEFLFRELLGSEKKTTKQKIDKR